jgi:hypothetical protein
VLWSVPFSMKGKVVMGALAKATRLKPNAATTMRLCHSWFGTGRTLIADSWFCTFDCVDELLNNDLYSIMCMKGGNHHCPTASTKCFKASERGWYVWWAEGYGALMACRGPQAGSWGHRRAASRMNGPELMQVVHSRPCFFRRPRFDFAGLYVLLTYNIVPYIYYIRRLL